MRWILALAAVFAVSGAANAAAPAGTGTASVQSAEKEASPEMWNGMSGIRMNPILAGVIAGGASLVWSGVTVVPGMVHEGAVPLAVGALLPVEMGAALVTNGTAGAIGTGLGAALGGGLGFVLGIQFLTVPLDDTSSPGKARGALAGATVGRATGAALGAAIGSALGNGMAEGE